MKLTWVCHFGEESSLQAFNDIDLFVITRWLNIKISQKYEVHVNDLDFHWHSCSKFLECRFWLAQTLLVVLNEISE